VGEIWKAPVLRGALNGDLVQVSRPTALNEKDKFPRFSPDGSRIAFSRSTLGGRVMSIRPDGTDEQAETAGGSWNGPAWLTNSRLTASKLGVGDESGFFAFDRGSTARTRLSGDQAAMPQCLTPDGQWVIYTVTERAGSADAGRLYIRRVDGTRSAIRLSDSTGTLSDGNAQIVMLPLVTMG
ncbi:MAG: hypothetical protein ABUL72_07230, partial [Armatimonadota bacterium]